MFRQSFLIITFGIFVIPDINQRFPPSSPAIDVPKPVEQWFQENQTMLTWKDAFCVFFNVKSKEIFILTYDTVKSVKLRFFRIGWNAKWSI